MIAKRKARKRRRVTARPKKNGAEDAELTRSPFADRPAVIDPTQDYTVKQAATLLCSSHTGVYRLVHAGVLKLKKRGRRSRISGADIIAANQL